MFSRNAIRLENTCPKCGTHLLVREGESGDFLACPKFPACRYTESLPDSFLKGQTTLKLRQQYCKKCNHTGLVHSKALGKFSGKPIPNSYALCECNPEEEIEHYRDIRPEDFDFPMSDIFREFSFELYGRPWEQREMS